MHATILDSLPLWAVFALTLTLVMLAVEAGYLLGKKHEGRHVQTSPVSTMVGATLGLLAFMLAFTFGMAGNRFEARKTLVIEDANAIRTAYLRADLVDKADTVRIHKLLREYADIRMNASLHPGDQTPEALSRTEQIQDALWTIGVRISREQVNSNTVCLFLQSLNDVVDKHYKRMNIAFSNRIPATIWLVLYSILFFSMAAIGYYSGITLSRSRLIAVVLALAFSSIFLLIEDLDRPHQGFMQVSQEAMIKVCRQMEADASRDAEP